MGGVLDGAIIRLVTSLIASVPPLNDANFKDTAVQLGYDKCLAQLVEMGFDIEIASKAIQDCRSLDLAAIVEHLNGVISSSTASDIDPSSREVPEYYHLLEVGVKVEENSQGDPQMTTLEAEASTIRRTTTMNKGKTPLLHSDGSEEGTLSERWKHDDPVTDKEASLLMMGFSQKNVSNALQSCGDDSDINDLVNFIMSMMVNLPNDCLSEEDDSWGEDAMDEDPQKCQRGSIEEETDQELLVSKRLENMGLAFARDMVSGAIKACGKDATGDELVDYLLGAPQNGLTELSELGNLTKLQQLQRLGFSTAACKRAIDSNGDVDISELLDYLEAEKIELRLREEDQQQIEEEDEHEALPKYTAAKRRKTDGPSKLIKIKEPFVVPKPSTSRNLRGFGLPGEPIIARELSRDIRGPPYFYFENVANMPKQEWNNIQRHLFNIEPEFLDSLNFSACRRPRGYIHNLPLEGRLEISPKPPMTIQELIPGSALHWPTWDPRVKLNTINTQAASEFVRRQIQGSLSAYENGHLSMADIKTILFWARKWNLVWIRPGVLVPLGPEEVEVCLGFDLNHTRILFSPIDRIRVLGNSFQVNTVAYHLSVLRSIYPSGIRVLSLFSGIGGAEVALHKLGIPLNVVVSVEIDAKARMVVDSWWKTTNQKGLLIHEYHDVKDLDSKVIAMLVERFGGFDLVIGGSPCNNLSGNNRSSRVGLAGTSSIAFFEFPRILKEVRQLCNLASD